MENIIGTGPLMVAIIGTFIGVLVFFAMSTNKNNPPPPRPARRRKSNPPKSPKPNE